MRIWSCLLLFVFAVDARAEINLDTGTWKLQVVFALIALLGVLIVLNWKKLRGLLGMPSVKDGDADTD